MSVDIFHGKLHKCRHTDCRLHIVAEHKECAASPQHSAMKHDTIDYTCHRKLRHSCMKKASCEIIFCDRACLLQPSVGLVGVGKVGTRYDHIPYMVGKIAKHISGSSTACHSGFEIDSIPIDIGELQINIILKSLRKLGILLSPFAIFLTTLCNNLLQFFTTLLIEFLHILTDDPNILGIATKIFYSCLYIRTGGRERLTMSGDSTLH